MLKDNYKKIAFGNTGFSEINPNDYLKKTISIPLNLLFKPSKILLSLSADRNFYFNYIFITEEYLTGRNFYLEDSNGGRTIFGVTKYTKEVLEITVTYCKESYMRIYFKDWIAIE